MRRILIALMSAALCAALVLPAGAYWSAPAAGAGSAAVGSLAAGGAVAATVDGRAVTLDWDETVFQGAALTSYPAGSYRVARVAAHDGAVAAQACTSGTT